MTRRSLASAKDSTVGVYDMDRRELAEIPRPE
jgi:hypothetical protein